MNNILFSEFKQKFYSRVKDFTLFDCGEFNLLKVVLDGLLVRYTERGKISNYFSFPIPVYKGILKLKHLRAKIKSADAGKLEKLNSVLEKYRKKKYLFIGAYDMNYERNTGKKKPYHFHNIIKDSVKSDVVLCDEKNEEGKMYSDINLEPYKEVLITRTFDEDEKILLKNLKKTFGKILKSKIFEKDELKNISIAFELFFLQYRIWKYVAHGIKPQKMFFRCHYHREGMLLAFKRANVKTIELQHGLIAPEDIFYMMPERIKSVRERALFADRIWVYGNFWKERLKKGYEYPEDKIDIVGYYPLDNSKADGETDERINNICRNKKVILIISQTSAHKYFIKYTKWLANDLMKQNLKDEYVIIFKPHPNEKKEIYDELKLLDNVYVEQTNIDFLLKKANLLISIYSTVIYEAKRYNITCFSLYIDEYADYVNAFVSSGISSKLLPNENPLFVNTVANNISREELFSEINGLLLSNELS